VLFKSSRRGLAVIFKSPCKGLERLRGSERFKGGYQSYSWVTYIYITHTRLREHFLKRRGTPIIHKEFTMYLQDIIAQQLGRGPGQIPNQWTQASIQNIQEELLRHPNRLEIYNNILKELQVNEPGLQLGWHNSKKQNPFSYGLSGRLEMGSQGIFLHERPELNWSQYGDLTTPVFYRNGEVSDIGGSRETGVRQTYVGDQKDIRWIGGMSNQAEMFPESANARFVQNIKMLGNAPANYQEAAMRANKFHGLNVADLSMAQRIEFDELVSQNMLKNLNGQIIGPAGSKPITGGMNPTASITKALTAVQIQDIIDQGMADSLNPPNKMKVSKKFLPWLGAALGGRKVDATEAVLTGKELGGPASTQDQRNAISYAAYQAGVLNPSSAGIFAPNKDEGNNAPVHNYLSGAPTAPWPSNTDGWFSQSVLNPIGEAIGTRESHPWLREVKRARTGAPLEGLPAPRNIYDI
jgi:hypothetical protein